MSKINTKGLPNNWFTYWFSGMLLKLAGWRIAGEMPDIPKAVVIVAPHTSNWDFPTGLMLAWRLRLKAAFIGKHTLFKGLSGKLFHWLGGIPVDRSSSHNLVEQVTQVFQQYDRFLITIAPEGTRKRVEHWKTGFYYIAQAAGVPIMCAYIDFKRKAGGFGLVIHPSGDIEADMVQIREFYRGITGKRPENMGPMLVPPR
ncbi:MAG: lysophospholipid acyltransferase family protein [Calditrichae bacterium]|nr:lysophospholipid acyltransferase family protein [Calditrichia bacterium]